MMGYQAGFQPKLFYHQINLEQRVPHNHLLRKIQAQIDFIYAEVQGSYGSNENVSVPPPVILKMLLLLVLYNVRSERELMDTIPFRLDWRWFLGYDFDSEVPDHSVLSKARSRWGEGLSLRGCKVLFQCRAQGSRACSRGGENLRSDYQGAPKPFFVWCNKKEVAKEQVTNGDVTPRFPNYHYPFDDIVSA